MFFYGFMSALLHSFCDKVLYMFASDKSEGQTTERQHAALYHVNIKLLS